MPFAADIEIDLSERIPNNYLISSQHRRRGNVNKCVWTISFDEEVECFVNTISNQWKIGSAAWGVKVTNKIPQVVGVNNSREELKLAKFVGGIKTNIWHGYPADYMNRSQDRPATLILQSWVKKGYITKAKMTKIRLGQPCNL